MEKTEQQVRFEAYILGKYPAPGAELLRVNDAKTQRDWEVWQAAEASAREQVAQWMLARSIATGHGDIIEDLLAAIVVHCEASALERAAKRCELFALHHADNYKEEGGKFIEGQSAGADQCAEAIRALAQEVGK